jgi:hypothetical protein
MNPPPARIPIAAMTRMIFRSGDGADGFGIAACGAVVCVVTVPLTEGAGAGVCSSTGVLMISGAGAATGGIGTVGVPVIAKSEKPADCAEQYTVPSFEYKTVVGNASQQFAVWRYSMMFFWSIWFSSSHDCGTVKLITAFVIVSYRAGTRLMYWKTMPGGAEQLELAPDCTVPVTISSESFVPVTIACHAFESPPMLTVTVMRGNADDPVVAAVPPPPPPDAPVLTFGQSSSLGTSVGAGVQVPCATFRVIYTVWPSTVPAIVVEPGWRVI